MPEKHPGAHAMAEMHEVAVTYLSGQQQVEAVRDISLAIAPGEFVSIVGPSGCGKSTLLGVLSGLITPTRGEARLEGEPVDGVPADIAYLFQQEALLPWKTVEGNIRLGLSLKRNARNPEQDPENAVATWIHKVGLQGFEQSYPYQLSGGMRRRAALAQALVGAPKVLLMDEPFGALDVQTRTLMEEELLQLWEEAQATVIFVTHDLEEAILLSDRVCLLRAGPRSTVKNVYEIPIARPRHLNELKYDAEFRKLYQSLWMDLRDEVMQAYQTPAASDQEGRRQ